MNYDFVGQSFIFTVILFYIVFVGALIIELIKFKKEKKTFIVVISLFILSAIFESTKLFLKIQSKLLGTYITLDKIILTIFFLFALIILYKIRKKVNKKLLIIEIISISLLTLFSIISINYLLTSFILLVNSIILFILICDFVIKNVEN